MTSHGKDWGQAGTLQREGKIFAKAQGVVTKVEEPDRKGTVGWCVCVCVCVWTRVGEEDNRSPDHTGLEMRRFQGRVASEGF